MPLASVLLAAPALGAVAAPSMRDVLVATYRIHDLTGVELAPDGGALTWTERFRDPRDPLHSMLYGALYVERRDGGDRRRLSAGNLNRFYDEEGAVWSPDGRQIAFLSDARSPDRFQVFVADRDGRNVREVGKLAGDVAAVDVVAKR